MLIKGAIEELGVSIVTARNESRPVHSFITPQGMTLVV